MTPAPERAAALLRRLRIALFGQSWPEIWAESSARLEAAAIKARASIAGNEDGR